MSDLRSLLPMIVVFAGLMGLMTWGFDTLLENRNHPSLRLLSAPDAPARVALKRNPAGRFVARGTINGEAVIFLVDTGADHVAVPERVAKRIGLTRGAPIRVITAGGEATAYTTQLESITLGPLEVQYVEGSINPAMRDEYVLLGNSFLRHVDFSKRGNELIIEAPAN